MYNGNGQGNNQGYGQQPQQQGGYASPGDVYDRLNNTRDVGGARFPYIAAGTHKLALVSLEEFGDRMNPKVRALFKTLDSRTQQVGGFCVKIWNILKPPRFQNGTTEADELADFARKLKGAPAGTSMAADLRMLTRERPLEQLARGTVIECTGVAGKPKNDGREPYVRVYWNTLPQDGAAVASMRQRLEAEGIPATGAEQQVYQQAPQGMEQRLQQAGFQNQGLYTVQNNMQGTMQQQNYAPQGQQGYVQQPGPAQGPAPQQNQQNQPMQQGAPQGGFLANVPTNNGGNNGQGGGWR